MAAAATLNSVPLNLSKPVDLGSADFSTNKYAYYPWLLEEAPVFEARISFMKIMAVTRYEDCVELLRDPRFVRNRSTARGGGSRMPFPVPKSISLIAQSMIVEDDPEHRRLRSLVNKAFKPHAIAAVNEPVQRQAHELIDKMEKGGTVDLLPEYCLPIPVAVISQLMGCSEEDTVEFQSLMKNLSEGLTGWNMLRTFVFQMPATIRFVRGLIDRKRKNPGDDILTGLIEAEEEGQRLTEDEIVAMTFLLVVAGFETTVHAIANGLLALFDAPDQMQRLREDAGLIDSAVEEMLRHRGPVHGTKMNYACEDVELHGVTIPRGTPTIPMLGAANHDPRAFDEPDLFDIGRDPNHHLAFSQGAHFCMGAQLARMEIKVAVQTLLERSPNLRLAVPRDEIGIQSMPFWHRVQGLPVVVG
jgi:cytochrome P450